MQNFQNIGDSPSGKATDSDSVIRVFESLIPSHEKRHTKRCAFFRALMLRARVPALNGCSREEASRNSLV